MTPPQCQQKKKKREGMNAQGQREHERTAKQLRD